MDIEFFLRINKRNDLSDPCGTRRVTRNNILPRRTDVNTRRRQRAKPRGTIRVHYGPRDRSQRARRDRVYDARTDDKIILT